MPPFLVALQSSDAAALVALEVFDRLQCCTLVAESHETPFDVYRSCFMVLLADAAALVIHPQVYQVGTTDRHLADEFCRPASWLGDGATIHC